MNRQHRRRRVAPGEGPNWKDAVAALPATPCRVTRPQLTALAQTGLNPHLHVDSLSESSLKLSLICFAFWSGSGRGDFVVTCGVFTARWLVPPTPFATTNEPSNPSCSFFVGLCSRGHSVTSAAHARGSLHPIATSWPR